MSCYTKTNLPIFVKCFVVILGNRAEVASEASQSLLVSASAASEKKTIFLRIPLEVEPIV